MVSAVEVSPQEKALEAIEAILMAKKKAATRDYSNRKDRKGDVSVAEMEKYVSEATIALTELKVALRLMRDGQIRKIEIDGRGRPGRGLPEVVTFAEDMVLAVKRERRKRGLLDTGGDDTPSRIVDTE